MKRYGVEGEAESFVVIKSLRRGFGRVEEFPRELLSRYEPLEFLGGGRFSKVFKVRRKSDNAVVAVKVLAELSEDVGRVFLNEVGVWTRLDHENIVKFFDANIHPVPYVEMEFVDGVEVGGRVVRTLEEYPKPVDERLAIGIVMGIARGLEYAHSRGVVHGDLKPSNIMLKKVQGRVIAKIGDWGLAMVAGSARLAEGFTPLYAAPEQLMPEKYGSVDNRTDIWQLGVVLYELLTGDLPFKGYTYEEVSEKITDGNYKFRLPSEYRGELSKYDRIVMKMLARNKEGRYRSVIEFIKDIEVLTEERVREAEKRISEIKETLKESLNRLKNIRTREEEHKHTLEVVEKLRDLVILCAEYNKKVELRNYLMDLKYYTEKYAEKHVKKLDEVIRDVETMIREGIDVGEDTINRLKMITHDILREVKEFRP